jgi:hypothetical protein
MNLTRWFRRTRAGETPERKILRFLGLPEHRWIANEPALLRRFALFLALLPAEHLAELVDERGLLFLYCNQRMSAAFYQFERREIVLVFPELRRLLVSAQYHQAYAVLAHELGHVLRGHSRRAIAPLDAQLEADAYARELGLGPDLAYALRFEEPTEELAARLDKLA